MSKNKHRISKYTPLESLEILYNDAKIEAGPPKSKWVTYADEIEHNEILTPHYVRLQSIIKKFQRIERIVQEYPRGLMGSQQARANAYILGQIMQVVADVQTAEAEQILTEKLKEKNNE